MALDDCFVFLSEQEVLEAFQSRLDFFGVITFEVLVDSLAEDVVFGDLF